MCKIEDLTIEVIDWIGPLFPQRHRDPINTCIKLTEEVSELMHAMYTKDGNIGEECADCLILLLDIAHLNKVDLTVEFWKKMEKNRDRVWKKKNGSLRHE
jgi:NTP pyrophosphatase (non-canonical NTP hydrolase)